MSEMLKMIGVLSLICALSGLTLASVRQATAPAIEEQVLINVQGPALEQVFRDYDNNPVKDRKKITLADGREITVFPAMKGGKLVALAMETFGKGFGGPVGIMVGFATDGQTLTGIGATTLKETPGLGMRLLEPEYGAQFIGHSVQGVALQKDGGNIAPIAGATISSTGSVAAVNEAIKIFQEIKPNLPAEWKS